MILYNSNYFGLPQLSTISGSAVYRTFLPSFFSSCLVFLYKYTVGGGKSARELATGDDEALYTVHPFVITIYIMAFSLILNHRLNYCYQRYWESCSNIFMMTSKWMDSATTLAAFHYQSVVYEEDRPRCFGDEDKPLHELNDKEKKKSAPTGGNTRTAMVNTIGDQLVVDNMGSNNSVTSASDTSDSALSLSDSLGDSFALDVAVSDSIRRESTRSHSQQSFVSIGSRERHRQYSEAENLRRTKRKLSSSSLSSENSASEGRSNDRRNILNQMFSWKNTSRRNIQNNRNLPKVHEMQDNRVRENDGSTTMNLGIGNKSDHSAISPWSNLPASTKGSSRRGMLLKFPSMPVIHSPKREDSGAWVSFADVVKRGINAPRRASLSKGITGHGINKTSSKHVATNHSAKATGRGHRRIPSTDIPVPGIGGSIVKSFKPNPSLDWQMRNRTPFPQNTGLHPTNYHKSFGLENFEKLLLEEEQERKQHEKQNSTGGEGFLGVARRRTSFQAKNLRRPSVREISNAESEIDADNPTRPQSDPTRGSVSLLSKSIDDDDFTRKSLWGNKKEGGMKFPSFPPRLELHDLPSLHKKHTAENFESSPNSGTGTGPMHSRLNAAQSRYHKVNVTAMEGNERQSSLLRTPAEKMNGRASLFLQEAAHLFSLMSAVAMATLRADMEGVSSPLVDYVPGQKFPPVNPEEMQIKIFLTDEIDDEGTQNNPNDELGTSKISQNDGKIGNESARIHSQSLRIKRNNKISNIIMFLFGMSRNSRQRTIYNASRPFSVLGGISDAEVEMLRKVRGDSAQHALCCLWLREFITREHLDGSTGGVAPPIVARVYQHISDGTQQYNNCRRTAFTHFPFPHAQLTSFFCLASTLVFPFLFYTYVESTFLALLLNFLTVSCFFGIQEVALELEEPFIRYPNDLPLNNYQAQFNEALISSLYGGFHPDAWGKAGDNNGIFSTGYEGGEDKNVADEIQNSEPSQEKDSVPIEDIRTVQGSRNLSSLTDEQDGTTSNSSLNSIIKTKNSGRLQRQDRNAMVQVSVPEASDL